MQTAKDEKLIYECPHCGHEVAVDNGLIGETCDCPNPDCGKPFTVKPPPGRLVETVHEDQHQEIPMPEVEGATDSETVVQEQHPAMFANHPIGFIGYCLMIGGGLIGALTYVINGSYFLALMFTILFLVGSALMGYWYLKVMFQVLTITSKRTIYRHGIIAKKTSEVQHDDVRNIQVDQNVFQRIMGIGDIAISSSGQDDMEIAVAGINDPDEVVETVRKYQ